MPRQTIYLIDSMGNQILGSKLSTLSDCIGLIYWKCLFMYQWMCSILNKFQIPTKNRADFIKKQNFVWNMAQ